MFFKNRYLFVNSKGQISVDLLIAVSIMVLTVTMATYYIISAFVPYSSRDIDLQASAYRVAMILSEDGGLWYAGPNLLESNWAEKVKASDYSRIRDCLKRIGLANTSTTYLTELSYEVQIPCYLNRTKVELFFNVSLWCGVWGNRPGYPYNYTLDRLATLIGLNSSVRHYYYNVSICYMNGTTVYDPKLRRDLTIGYPLYMYRNGKKIFIPKEFGKFERIVVIDSDYNPGEPPNKLINSLRRLVVYVW